MSNSDESRMLRQAGADVPIPRNLSREYQEVLNTVLAAQKILDSVGGSYGLQLWIIPRPEFEEKSPTLDFLVNGFTQVSLSLMHADEGLSGFVWKHESMNLGGYSTKKLPVFNSPWSLIFQLLWLTHDLVEGCTEFIGQEVKACDDFNVINRIRHLVASGMLAADGENMLWCAKTYLINIQEEDDEEYESEEQEDDDFEDECINDGDCSGSCDSCSRVRIDKTKSTGTPSNPQENVSVYSGIPDPNDPLCGLPNCQ